MKQKLKQNEVLKKINKKILINVDKKTVEKLAVLLFFTTRFMYSIRGRPATSASSTRYTTRTTWMQALRQYRENIFCPCDYLGGKYLSKKRQEAKIIKNYKAH